MRSLRTLCQIVTVIFVAVVIVSAFAAQSDLALLQYIEELSAGGPVDEAKAERIDAHQAMMGLVQVGLLVVCAIVFLRWFHRAHKNLKAAGLKHLTYTPGWAIGGFFVPFLNLVRPFQVIKEVWMGTAYLAGKGEAESWKTGSPSPLVGWWWGLFLISSFLSNASARLLLRADELEEFMTAEWGLFASDLMDIPSAILALHLVRRITDLQERARTHPRPDKLVSDA